MEPAIQKMAELHRRAAASAWKPAAQPLRSRTWRSIIDVTAKIERPFILIGRS